MKEPKTFGNLLRKFCLNGTISGIKYFYIYPDRMSRCFWLVHTAAVVTLAYMLSSLLYAQLTEMPTRLTIENQNEPAHNLPYPAITLCSPNQMTASFMRHFNKTIVDGNITINLESVLPMLLGFYQLLYDFDSDALRNLQTLLDNNRYTMLDIMTESPQKCEDFLKLCSFEGLEYDCSELFKPILTAHGLCCAFNSVYHLKDKRNVRNRHFKVATVNQGGSRNGLFVVTDYNIDNAVESTVLYSGAVKIMYTDHTEFPADDEAALVESYIESYHEIRAAYTYCSDTVKLMSYWSRKCFFDTEYRLPWFGKYHNTDCNHTCYALAVERECHCHLFYLPRADINQLCNMTSIPCILRVKGKMREWMSLELCNCPEDCESRKYKIDLFIGNFEAMSHMILNPFKNLMINQSTSTMYFYFVRPIYVKQKQESIMSSITFASNIGGVLGLCLGCSVISVLEIISYSYAAIKYYIQRKCARRVRIRISPTL